MAIVMEAVHDGVVEESANNRAATMSLRQIKYIGAVGRFRTCAAEGDVTFKKYTLIFGENGRGKTTLCSILRSLQNDDSAIVLGRKTLGGGKEPNIVLNFADGAILFKDGTWNTHEAPNIRRTVCG